MTRRNGGAAPRTIARPYLALGLKCRKARERTGLSQENFAPQIQTTRRHLIRVEGGQQQPSRALLDRIADASGVPRESLTNEDEDEEAALERQNAHRALDVALDTLARLAVERAQMRGEVAE